MQFICAKADCDPMLVLADDTSSWMAQAADNSGGSLFAQKSSSWAHGQRFVWGQYQDEVAGGWPSIGEQILSTVCFHLDGGQTAITLEVNGHGASTPLTFSGAPQLDQFRLSLYGGDISVHESWNISLMRVSQTDQCNHP